LSSIFGDSKEVSGLDLFANSFTLEMDLSIKKMTLTFEIHDSTSISNISFESFTGVRYLFSSMSIYYLQMPAMFWKAKQSEI